MIYELNFAPEVNFPDKSNKPDGGFLYENMEKHLGDNSNPVIRLSVGGVCYNR
jgi:hypothetical protein